MSGETRGGRVVSGMRPTGALHLGHYHGVLKNWLDLQFSSECFFFVADWHALTTHYESPREIPQDTLDMVIDWLACGIDPGEATLFVQSQVPEHAELHLLLSMITPLAWLERVPSYKDRQRQEPEKTTYGFLGYPLLQAADILIYRAGHVPVGKDQVAHVELCREIARRFNHLYGRDPDYLEKVEEAVGRMSSKDARLLRDLRRRHREVGDDEALEVARALIESQRNFSPADRECLIGHLESDGRMLLREPQPLLTPASKVPGVDGGKMSKSLHNTISLREDAASVERKLRTMPTDPARVRRSDPGDPDKCPVWGFHQIYSDDDARAHVAAGCRSASIGCVECKRMVSDAVIAELKPIRARAEEYAADSDTVAKIVAEGNAVAREAARDTLDDVRRAVTGA